MTDHAATPLKDQDRADAHRSKGNHSRRPSAPGLPVCLHVHAVVQGTPAIDPVPARCGALCCRPFCAFADDAAALHRIAFSRRG
jgi:hypothetical protein